jgi:hypothetical protein
MSIILWYRSAADVSVTVPRTSLYIMPPAFGGDGNNSSSIQNTLCDLCKKHQLQLAGSALPSIASAPSTNTLEEQNELV